mmetsp:Transcript_7518/g.17531  ORF Transcript_7518/g.17531 Transcript_7518/m.17531 type:complete len:250 (-) Transcript_7518:495-1244(-)
MVHRGDLPRKRAVRRVALAPVPRPRLAVVRRLSEVDAERRAAARRPRNLVRGREAAAPLEDVARLELHVVAAVDEEAEHALHHLEGGAGRPPQDDGAPQLLGAALDHDVGPDDAALREAHLDGVRAVQDLLAEPAGGEGGLPLVIRQVPRQEGGDALTLRGAAGAGADRLVVRPNVVVTEGDQSKSPAVTEDCGIHHMVYGSQHGRAGLPRDPRHELRLDELYEDDVRPQQKLLRLPAHRPAHYEHVRP